MAASYSLFVRLFVLVIATMSISAIGQPTAPGETPVLPRGQGLSAPITSPLDRVAFNLNGEWRHIPDPYDNGSLSHLSRPLDDGWWLDRKRAQPGERIEYDFARAESIDVPDDWNSQRDELYFYEGTLWYQREFDIDADASKRYFLYFGAVNRHADVWLNGEYLGSHHVGFTPFHFEITGKIAKDDNSIVVRVDNRRRPEDVPAMRTDWWNYGGLTRDVAILETPSTFIRSWEVRLNTEGTAAVGWVQIDGPEAFDTECMIQIGQANSIKTTARTNGSGRAHFELPWSEKLALWSPKVPQRQIVEISAASGDRARDLIGFRTIKTDGRDILLNGERIFLRGICLHEEAPDRPGRAWSEQDARALMGWAKELGCNYVRLAHYTHNEHMLRIADEFGLLVWAEIPVYWVLDFENSVTRAYAETHLSEMIERDRNRASVIIWSVGNENEGSKSQTALRRDLAALARKLDPSRLISAACFVRMTRGSDGRLNGVFVDDPFGEFADILAINEYIGWYHDSTDQLGGLPVETSWEKPLLISEFGVGIKQGLRGSPDEVWSEEFGVQFYQDQLEWCDELREAGALQGLSPWILKDFRSPRRPLAEVQEWYNRKGLISESGMKKNAFSVVQNRYHLWRND